MEISHWTRRILGATTLEEKLLQPESLTDHQPGPAQFWDEPSRPEGMHFSRRSKQEKLPPFHTLDSADHRAICLHRFAGHELLAVEIMAHALVAFPDAPSTFRRGLAHTLKEEQEHVKLYMKRMEELGLQFGDLPQYKHFWSHVKFLTSPIKYVSTMCLTFEMANLDFAPMYGEAFARYGDDPSAALMATIVHDEISHVGFGMRWLKQFKEKHECLWEAWVRSQSELLTPQRAKGFLLHKDSRREAGVPEEWLHRLENC